MRDAANAAIAGKTTAGRRFPATEFSQSFYEIWTQRRTIEEPPVLGRHCSFNFKDCGDDSEWIERNAHGI